MDKLQRIKLMMNYDLRRTLNENLEENNLPVGNLDELGIRNIEASAEDLSKLGQLTGKDLETFDKALLNGAETVRIGPKNYNSWKQIEMDWPKLSKDATAMGELRKQLISNLPAGNATREALINHLISSEGFFKEFSGLTKEEIAQKLASKYPNRPELTADMANKFIAKDLNGDFNNYIAKYGRRAGTDAAIDVENFKKTAQNNLSTAQNMTADSIGADTLVLAKDESEVTQNIQDLKAENPKAAEIVEKNVETEKKLTFKEKWNTFKTKYLSKKWLAGFGAIIGAGVILKFLFGGNTTPELNPCLIDLANSNDDNGGWRATSAGDPVFLVKQSGRYADADAKGGLWFFNNGRVMTADQGKTKRGTYSCSGGQVSLSEQAAADRLGGIQITWDGEATKTEKTKTEKTTTGGSKYKTCNDFPFTFGCKNIIITDIQKCLGLEAKYQTGNFGPMTKQKLVDAKINDGSTITLDDYNKIRANCYGQPQTEPQKVDLGPAPIVAPTTNDTPTAEPQQTQAPVQPPSAPEVTGDQLYSHYLASNYFNAGKIGDQRVKYKGPDLTQSDLDKLNQYLVSQGYKFLKDKDKGTQYGAPNTEKYVWTKVR